MIRNFYAIAIVCTAGIVPAMAQTTTTTDEEEKKPFFKFSGSADVYIKYDMQKNPANTYTSFTNTHNSFELGMISAKVEHQGKKVSLVGDIGFGSRVEQFTYNDSKSNVMIKQLYLSYAPAEWVKFSMGSWATHVGYELVDPYLNRNYSMSYMFSYGPFFHTGIKAEFVFGQHGFMVGITDPADLKSAMELQGEKYKYFIGQYSYGTKNGNFKSYLNVFAGKRNTDTANVAQLDLVMTQKINNKFSLGANASFNNSNYPQSIAVDKSKKWWGAALYLNYDAPKTWGLTWRTEYFDDKEKLNVYSSSLASTGGNVWANTLTCNLKVSSLTIMPEVRYEIASQDIYFDLDGNSFKHDLSFLLSAIYQF